MYKNILLCFTCYKHDKYHQLKSMIRIISFWFNPLIMNVTSLPQLTCFGCRVQPSYIFVPIWTKFFQNGPNLLKGLYTIQMQNTLQNGPSSGMLFTYTLCMSHRHHLWNLVKYTLVCFNSIILSTSSYCL